MPDPTAGGFDSGRWRGRLLAGIMRAALVAGSAALLLAAAAAWRHGDWTDAAAAAAALGVVALLTAGPRLAYSVRTWCFLGVLFFAALWLLVRFGAPMQIYLLACPLLATLLLPLRTALALLALSVVVVVGAGYGSGLPIAMGGPGPLAKWLIVGANFALIGSLVTLSCAFLLRRLEHSLRLQRAAATSLRANQETLRQIAAQVPGMVYRIRIHPDGRPQYLYASPGIRDLFGLEPKQLVADGTLIRKLWHPDDRARVEAEMRRVRETGAPLETELRVCLPDGRERWLHISSSAVLADENGVVRNGIVLDVTERKAAEALVWRQANFDALTGLPNRSMMRDRLEHGIARSRRENEPLALMFIDLDRFKEVNDTLGHDSGDRLLVEAARRIASCVRETDTVARMGGDEFTVVVPCVGSAGRVDAIAAQIVERLGAAFTLGSERAYVSASIGITLFPDDGVQIDELLTNADQALYLAKDAGRNCFRYFTRELQGQAQERARLVHDLRLALAREELTVHYQPIVELATGEVVKAEALVRWQHRERGFVSPAVFIPLAESAGMIGAIGELVFRAAAAQVKRWQGTIDAGFQISVNRSPLQFRCDAAADESWPAHLERLGLAGRSIAVEITEGLLLDAGADVSRRLRALREAGIPVLLDDFGTGYSSLSYLQKFAIDVLKIDRSFVAALQHRGTTGRALCKAMIVMAHELGMKVVAEGVETREQLDWLHAAGCDYAQGYWFARAMPPAEFEAFVERRRAAIAAL